MVMDFNGWLVLMASGLLVSCGQIGKPKEAEDPLAGVEAYKKAGGKLRGFDAESAAGADVNVSVSSASVTADEDIVWAPEDDSVPMPGHLQDLWKQPENESWFENYTKATRQSRQTGLPLMIWFTDSSFSVLCRNLSNELFSTSGFESWATQHLVRLRVDNTITSKTRDQDGIGKHNDIMNQFTFLRF